MAPATEQKEFFRQEKTIIPRIVDEQPNSGPLVTTLHNLIAIAERDAQTFDKTARAHAPSDAGREVLRAETLNGAEMKLRAAVDADTASARDHLAQVERELRDVASIDPFLAQEIRSELRRMTPAERAALLRDTDDPQIVAAVVHGPQARALALADETTATRMLTRYNATHRAEKFALAQALRHRIESVSNFRDMLLRRLRDLLR